MSNLPVLAQALPSIPGMRLHAQAMLFDHELSWKEYESLWAALLDMLDLADECLPYWIGDLLNEVEFRYGETYAQLIDAFPNLKVDTLRHYKWVCGKVPAGTRIRVWTRVHRKADRLRIPFTHSRLVAGMASLELREEALQMAMENDWSTRELREWLSLREQVAPLFEPKPVVTTEGPVKTTISIGGKELEAEVTYTTSVDPGPLEKLDYALKVAWRAIGERDWVEAGEQVDRALSIVSRLRGK